MEYWEVCNACGDRTGQIRPKGAFFGPGEYHPAMEAWIKNSRGEILIQQRSVECEILPGALGINNRADDCRRKHTARLYPGDQGRAWPMRYPLSNSIFKKDPTRRTIVGYLFGAG